MNETQRNHKDRLFRFLFGNEAHKDWTLSLYNALNGSSYDDPEAIEFNTLEDVLYLKMKNDISFILSWQLSMWEHQSTWNPNMPVRFLNYLSGVYEGIIEESEESRYGRRLIPLPAPRCVVFYNGQDKEFSQEMLRLSDSFPKGKESDVEVTVHVININDGKNESLISSCQPLKEYSWLIQRMRMYYDDGISWDLSIDRAISDMPEDFLIKPILVKQKVSVKEMLLTEYDEEKELKKLANSYYLEGYDNGVEEGVAKGIAKGEASGTAKTEHNTIFRMFDLKYSNEKVFEFYEGKYTYDDLVKLRSEWESKKS